MQYHHSFHAGNFADVHKHATLLALLAALQVKAKGFLYLDTHAASGLADLGSGEARRGAESARGWQRLAQSEPEAPELRALRSAVFELQRIHGGERHYPGSPLLAAHGLREQDRGIAIESQAPTARALERNLAAVHLGNRMRAMQGDGFAQLAAHWPPRERRSLALIDPPYEATDEGARALDTMCAGLERFETGVIALWFPIKRQRDLDRWLTRVSTAIRRPTLAALLWLHPLDSAAGLNGSGMLVVNPPYAMSQRLVAWQDELQHLLGSTGSGNEVRWLVNERA